MLHDILTLDLSSSLPSLSSKETSQVHSVYGSSTVMEEKEMIVKEKDTMDQDKNHNGPPTPCHKYFIFLKAKK